MIHQPVLLKEVIDALQVKPGGCYVDGTVGGGGHAEAILEKMQGKGRYLAIDRDAQALRRARERLKRFGNQISYMHGVFSELSLILEKLNLKEVEGVLVDLGVSSFQLEEAERGFSFLKEGPLDMRMDPDSDSATAAEWINEFSEEELLEIFQKFGEERFARRIARAIVAFRRVQPFSKTTQLAELISRVVPAKFRPPRTKIHPATRVFQAIRIAINDELGHLSRFLNNDFGWVKKGGRIAIISFHSLEDRLVKQIFRSRSDLRVVNRKPIVSEEGEIELNPRARSAKLRIAEKTINT